MSIEQHLIENCLFTYHRAVKDNWKHAEQSLQLDPIIEDQCKDIGIDIYTMSEFTIYVYWTLLDEECRKRIFKNA